MENRRISAERIAQYTTLLCEPPLVIESNLPGHCWPFHGEVEIFELQVLSTIYFLFQTQQILIRMWGSLSASFCSMLYG